MQSIIAESNAQADTEIVLDPITKITRILKRDNGVEVKIVAESMFGSGLHKSTDLSVFKRHSPEESWHLCDNRPAPGWKEMPRAEYLEKGRSEVLRTVSHGELLGTSRWLGSSLAAFNERHTA